MHPPPLPQPAPTAVQSVTLDSDRRTLHGIGMMIGLKTHHLHHLTAFGERRKLRGAARSSISEGIGSCQGSHFLKKKNALNGG